VFENRMLRRISGPKDEVAGGWRKLHTDNIYNLYSSSNVIRVISSRRVTWAGHVARMEEMKNTYGILVKKREGKRPLGRRITLKWILKK
jgi:hypothetical protein